MPRNAKPPAGPGALSTQSIGIKRVRQDPLKELDAARLNSFVHQQYLKAAYARDASAASQQAPPRASASSWDLPSGRHTTQQHTTDAAPASKQKQLPSSSTWGAAVARLPAVTALLSELSESDEDSLLCFEAPDFSPPSRAPSPRLATAAESHVQVALRHSSTLQQLHKARFEATRDDPHPALTKGSGACAPTPTAAAHNVQPPRAMTAPAAAPCPSSAAPPPPPLRCLLPSRLERSTDGYTCSVELPPLSTIFSGGGAATIHRRSNGIIIGDDSSVRRTSSKHASLARVVPVGASDVASMSGTTRALLEHAGYNHLCSYSIMRARLLRPDVGPAVVKVVERPTFAAMLAQRGDAAGRAPGHCPTTAMLAGHLGAAAAPNNAGAAADPALPLALLLQQRWAAQQMALRARMMATSCMASVSPQHVSGDREADGSERTRAQAAVGAPVADVRGRMPRPASRFAPPPSRA